MQTQPTLHPFALTSLEAALAYLRRDGAVASDDQEQVTWAVNEATARIMAWCGRQALRVRTFRNPVTLASLTTTINDETVTGIGFTASVKQYDEVVGTQVAPGTRVASVTSNTSLELDRKAILTSAGGASLAFGSEVLLLNGDDAENSDRQDGSGLFGYGNAIYAGEHPLNAVYSLKYVSDLATGALTALDTTAAVIVRETGYIILRNDSFPRGRGTVQLECSVGYIPPSSTARGDWMEWPILEHACKRVVQVMFQQYKHAMGAKTRIEAPGGTFEVQDFKMPEDVAEALLPFRRMW